MNCCQLERLLRAIILLLLAEKRRRLFISQAYLRPQMQARTHLVPTSRRSRATKSRRRFVARLLAATLRSGSTRADFPQNLLAVPSTSLISRVIS